MCSQYLSLPICPPGTGQHAADAPSRLCTAPRLSQFSFSFVLLPLLCSSPLPVLLALLYRKRGDKAGRAIGKNQGGILVGATGVRHVHVTERRVDLVWRALVL